MLDNEPDAEQQSTTNTEPAPPAPRRRRAASRPAGPPASAVQHVPAVEDLNATPVDPPSVVASQAEVPAPAAQQAEVPAPAGESQAQVPAPVEESQPEVAAADLPVSDTEAAKPATKRPARRTTAKKAAEPAPDAEPTTAEAPAKRAPRKRTSKKPAEPADSVQDLAPGPTEGPAGWVERTGEPVEPVEPEAAAAEAPASPATSADPAVTPSGAAVDDLPPDPVLVASVDPDPQPEMAEPERVEPEQAEPEQAEPEQAELEPEEPEAVALPETVRDFSWLADPFAVPAAAGNQQEIADTLEGEPSEPAAAEDDDEAAASDDDETGDGTRRRRRRRGGRRRRRSGGEEDSSETDGESDEDPSEDGEQGAAAARVETSTDTTTDEPATESETETETEGDESEGQRRRRRRRRRRGEEGAALPDDPTDVVVRVREPRPRKRAATSSSEVTGIEGSTRMEAKRQRRREGRDAGRRRAPILSEAEFLARRESVLRQMIIRQSDELAQIAVLEDGILVEHYVDRDSAASLIGNVYLGRVQNVLPSMEAAFVDIGRGRNAVLYAGEVDWDSFGADGHNRKVERVLKSGQMILVQVSKDPVGAKGARLTNHVSIPGRYIVYAPGGHLSGISRKLPDIERKRLKDILADLVGESASVIVRTAAEGASEDELVRDVNRLKAQWADIEKKVKAGNSPQLLYGEPDLTVRIVRDLFTEDFSELIIQGNGSMNDAYDAVQGYVSHVAPHLQERIRRWEPAGETDLFGEYRLDEQIAKALERKVFLPSGGSLVLDRTEAMTVIDVNTGKFTGTGGNLEATVTSNNLEAAEEIVRQLRLRDVGGIIVIDFIDMVLPSNRELLLRRLVECLGRDRTRHQVAEVTSLGLIQMTRKKIGTGLLEAFGTECPHCHGRGYELHDMPVDSQQQADGGTREQRGRDNRSRGQDSGSRNGSSRNGTPRTDDAGSTTAATGSSAEVAPSPTRLDAAPSSRSRGGRRARASTPEPDAQSDGPGVSAPEPEPATSD